VGTASLVLGIVLIGMGIYFLFTQGTNTPAEDAIYDLAARLILGIPSIVIGGLLLRKYDRDKKKEKNS